MSHRTPAPQRGFPERVQMFDTLLAATDRGNHKSLTQLIEQLRSAASTADRLLAHYVEEGNPNGYSNVADTLVGQLDSMLKDASTLASHARVANAQREARKWFVADESSNV